MYQKSIRNYLEAHKDEMVEDIKALVKIDSARTDAKKGMPFGEGAAEALKEGTRILEKHGFAVTNYDNYALDTRLNNKELQLDVLAHLDVVPAGDGWTVTEPFVPVVKDGKIYGRGTSDDKGPAIAALYAMKAIRELGIELKKDVRLILGSDEECGSADISYYFSKQNHAPMSISPDADFPLIFLEKGSLHTSFEAKTGLEDAFPRILSINAGTKVNVVPAKAEAVVQGIDMPVLHAYCLMAYYRLGFSAEFDFDEVENGIRIVAKGTSAHAATPMEGSNALTALLDLLVSLPLAPSRITSLVESVHRLFPHGDYYGAALGVNHEDEISGKLTLTLDIFNLDGEKMSGMFDCRACVSANDENTRDVIYRKFEEAGFEHSISNMSKPHYVPKDSLLVQTLLASYTKVAGKVEEPLAIGGGTYVHSIENGVACGCADPAVDNHMHGPDEFVIIDQMIMSACVFADAMIALCGVEL